MQSFSRGKIRQWSVMVLGWNPQTLHRTEGSVFFGVFSALDWPIKTTKTFFAGLKLPWLQLVSGFAFSIGHIFLSFGDLREKSSQLFSLTGKFGFGCSKFWWWKKSKGPFFFCEQLSKATFMECFFCFVQKTSTNACSVCQLDFMIPRVSWSKLLVKVYFWSTGENLWDLPGKLVRCVAKRFQLPIFLQKHHPALPSVLHQDNWLISLEDSHSFLGDEHVGWCRTTAVRLYFLH